MDQPAARLIDMQVCPMVTPGMPPIPHVSGPIVRPCASTALTVRLLQARVIDLRGCGSPPDRIAKASPDMLYAVSSRFGSATRARMAARS